MKRHASQKHPLIAVTASPRRFLVALAGTIALAVALTASAEAAGSRPQGKAVTNSAAAAQYVGKVRVCHKTGSGAYVLITISEDALAAHRAHGDIYPVPASGCPESIIQTKGVKASLRGVKTASLPFTGLSLWPFVAAGITLLGAGALLRRRTRTHS